MLLATRCPFCETVFRLQPTQLAQRRGLVRCGHCEEVFDASSSLFDTAEGTGFSAATPISSTAALALAAGAQPGRKPAPDFGAASWDPWAPAADAVFEPSLHRDPTVLPFAPMTVSGAVTPPTAAASHHLPPASFDNPVADPREPSFAGTPASAPEPEPEPEPEPAEPVFMAAPPPASMDTASHEPHFGTHSAEPFTTVPPKDEGEVFAVVREIRAPEPRRSGWRIVGVLVALILFAGLLVQLAWWQRETVMVYWPPSQTLFAKACGQLGCEVGPPRDIDGFVVEPPDLRQLDEPHKLEFRLPLRNRFNVALAYPAVELTLLDDKNNVAVRRVLRPQDYLKPGTPVAAGLPARTTQTMIVQLDIGQAIATNFRVQIFYP
jgi:predicted Zn finger-like uncharacterized protein